MGILEKIFGKKRDQDALFQLNLRDESLEHRGIENGIRVWETPEGDRIGLYYLGMPPDLPRNQPTVDAFCSEYRSLVQGDVVETGIEDISGISVVRIIGKAAQDPSGMTYVGSYTIPFRDFSYIVKIMCAERGMTGIREAVLLDKGLASGEVEFDDAGGIIGNFAPEDAIHDDTFPDHPLSRCRRGLRMIASSLHLSDEIRSLPDFELPRC